MVRRRETFWRVAIALVLTTGGRAMAQSPPPSLLGTWGGDYVCAQGKTGLTLSIDRQSGTEFAGFFHFYPLPENDRAKEGCYAVTGTLRADNSVYVRAGLWISQPANYETVDLMGTLNVAALSLEGSVEVPSEPGKPCADFAVRRQSSTVAPALACQGKGVSGLRLQFLPAAQR